MGIQFYNGLGNYGNYNRYQNNIPAVKPEDIKTEELKLNEQKVNEQEPSISAQPAIDNRSRTANLEDISLTFNKEESFDYLGNDSSIKTLDMQKAISDMKKDGILEEYQYFVGKNQAVYADADGVVVSKN